MIYQTENRPTKGVSKLNIFLSFLIIALSVGIIEFFNRYDVQFAFLVITGILYFLRYRNVEPIVWRLLLIAALIQLTAMYHFDAFRADRFISLGLVYTRVLTGYFILKIGGKHLLFDFEKVSYTFILLGLPLFFISHHVPGALSFFRNFDLNSIEIQRLNGGWNIFFFVYSGWAGYRFCGYAYEPGGMALMIVISWLIHIYQYGTVLNKKTFVYMIAMSLTFSTAGYLAMVFIIFFYALNSAAKKSIFTFAFIGVLLIVTIPVIWQQEFMKEKLERYVEFDGSLRSSAMGYAGTTQRNIGRLSAWGVAYENLVRWPLGHGTVEEGRLKTVYGDILSGANGIAYFFITWGIFGGLFIIYTLYLFNKRFKDLIKLKYKAFLTIPLFIVFASNSMGTRIITYIIMFFPYVHYFHNSFIENNGKFYK
jgi:hypothetical protein